MKALCAVAAVLALAVCAGTAHADQYSIMPTLTPATADLTNDNPSLYELGTKFQTDVDGQILALRYWLPAAETGSHTGNLWTSTGTLLESVAFPAVTPPGSGAWEQATLATPINITAGQIYVVSVNTSLWYPDTDQGLATSIVNGPIHTVADGDNGLYATTPGAFPTNQYDNSNYYRDVVFQTAPVPEPASLSLLVLGALPLLTRRRKTA